MIQRILRSELLNGRPINSITSAAFIIALSGLVSRILGLVRDRVLAARFGAGDELDVYYSAFRIPDLIYNLLILGALSAAFIPVFTRLLSQQKEKEAWAAAAGILNLTVSVMAVLSLILMIFTRPLMEMLTPGFDAEKTDLAVTLTRIMFLSPLLLGISSVFGGILVSLKKFLYYSLAPILYNVGIIIGAVFFVDKWGIVGLSWGVVLGAFMHLLVQFPEVRSSGFIFSDNFFNILKNSEVRKIIYLMIPRTFSIAVTQINLLIITVFASMLEAGSLSVFNLANNIQSAPLGLFGISFAIAAFPSLSSAAAHESKQEFVETLSRTMRQIIFFILPITVMIVILRAQLVRVFFGSGKFDWEDTSATFAVLGVMAASLFAQSLIPLLTRAFYALHNTKTPLYIAIFGEAVNIGLVLALIGRYQILGLAIAFSVASIVNMLLLLIMLHRQMEGLDNRRNLDFITRITLITLVVGIVMQVSKTILGSYFNLDTFPEVFVQLLIPSLLGLAIFCLMGSAMRIEEYAYFRKAVSRRLFRAKSEIREDAGEVSGI